MQSLGILPCMSCQEPDWDGILMVDVGNTCMDYYYYRRLACHLPGNCRLNTETHDISKDIMTVSMGPVVSGTNQNSTVIRIVSDNPCTPSLRYANESFFSVSKDYDRDVPGVLEWNISCNSDYRT